MKERSEPTAHSFLYLFQSIQIINRIHHDPVNILIGDVDALGIASLIPHLLPALHLFLCQLDYSHLGSFLGVLEVEILPDIRDSLINRNVLGFQTVHVGHCLFHFILVVIPFALGSLQAALLAWCIE